MNNSGRSDKFRMMEPGAELSGLTRESTLISLIKVSRTFSWYRQMLAIFFCFAENNSNFNEMTWLFKSIDSSVHWSEGSFHDLAPPGFLTSFS